MDFIKNFKEYLKLPEMKIFWLFLFLIGLVLIIDAVFLDLFWTIISALILFSAGGIMFFANIQSSKTSVRFESEKPRVDSIISGMKDGIIVYDQDFIVRLFNSGAENIFNLRAGEIIGKKLSPESARDPKLEVLTKIIFQSLAPQVVRQSAENEYPQTADLSFTEPSLELRVTTDRIHDERGNITGFLKIVRDQTREIELLKSKSEFITVAAHQLRTPLSALNWSFQSLSKENLNDSQKELVQTGLGASANLLKIVEDLLNVAKIEEGKFGYNFQEINLAVFLQELVGQSLSVAKAYGVKVYMEPAQEQFLMVNVDAERISLAVANLLENAIKYNVPNGKVVLSIERQAGAPYLQVNVSDTGLGMSKETMDKLFTKFFRGENAVAKETDGSGLGLYMVKNIIRRHGGKIWVESELNRGTTFHFTLPTDPKLIPQREISDQF